MRIIVEHHVYLHPSPAEEQIHARILNELDAVRDDLTAIKEGNTPMFEDLQAKVDAIKSASDAAEALLVGLKAKLDEFIANSHLNAEDAAKLQAITDSIGSEAGELAAAVEANTPAA